MKKIFLCVLLFIIPAFVLAVPRMQFVKKHGVTNVDFLCDLQQKAQRGDAESAAYLGMKYVGGTIGILPNYKLGLYWLKKAAQQKVPLACYILARYYLEGCPGLSVNKQKAQKYAKIAFDAFQADLAANKYSKAMKSIIQYNLGDLYFWGFPGVVKQDLAKAFALTKLAANGGDEHAMRRLSLMYRYGVGTKSNLVKAHKWSLFLANLGLVEAQYATGLDYINGIGTATNRDKGLYWLSEAAGNGYYPAIIELVELSKQGKITSISDTRRMRIKNVIERMMTHGAPFVAK
ncbi:MAG: tetratricopeptide repeat protein [Gammaproteobacteria bacterium]|jgi:TPR repeat protein